MKLIDFWKVVVPSVSVIESYREKVGRDTHTEFKADGKTLRLSNGVKCLIFDLNEEVKYVSSDSISLKERYYGAEYKLSFYTLTPLNIKNFNYEPSRILQTS